MRPWDSVWAAWFLIFVILEFLAVFGVAPWETLSSTAWGLERLSDVFKILFLSGLVVLTVHIVFDWP